jgi:dihydrofolate reductase
LDLVQFTAGKKYTDTEKVVFTKTLDKSDWDNTVLAKGAFVTEINNLKSQDGGDITAYGGAQFVSSLIKARLIDEYHLFINPTAIGKGLTIFGGLNSILNLNLTNSKRFDCGIIVNIYTPKPD